jgi:uncharacterized protein
MPLSRSAVARIAPFALFIGLLALRGSVSAGNTWGVDPRWIYGAGVLLVGGLLAWWWKDYGELDRQNWPTVREALLGAATGLLVFGLWIRLDAPWMVIGEPSTAYVPVTLDGRLDLPLVLVRWVGATMLVPVMEELFWRSFLMRWIERTPFEAVPPQRVGLKAVVLSTFVFTLAHTLWLAAALAGLAYAWLYVRTGKLWVPVIAHAVTNGVLGLWVVGTGRWQFW